jgi:hypothetical protein
VQFGALVLWWQKRNEEFKTTCIRELRIKSQYRLFEKYRNTDDTDVADDHRRNERILIPNSFCDNL